MISSILIMQTLYHYELTIHVYVFIDKYIHIMFLMKTPVHILIDSNIVLSQSLYYVRLICYLYKSEVDIAN